MLKVVHRLKVNHEIIGIQNIKDIEFHQKLTIEFKRLFVKLFQLTAKQR